MNYESALKLFQVKDANNKELLKKIYKTLAKKMHPDAGGTQDSFLKLTKAYSILKNQKQQRTILKQENSNKNNEIDHRLLICQKLKLFQYLVFWFFVVFLRYKIVKRNGFIYLKTNKGKYFLIVNKQENINNIYLKLESKYVRIPKTRNKFLKINEIIFIIFI